MDIIYVDDRIPLRHPEIQKPDVIYAWKNSVRSCPRLEKNPDEYLAIGIDGKGRFLEMVGIRDSYGDWLVYHALTPPTDNALRELEMGRKKR